MSRPDDIFGEQPDPELQRRLSELFTDEPPMDSLVHHDLVRGQRLVRRRRWQAIGAAAVLVPALTVGTVAVTNAVSDSSASSGTRLEPADEGDGVVQQGDDSSGGHWSCVSAPKPSEAPEESGPVPDPAPPGSSEPPTVTVAGEATAVEPASPSDAGNDEDSCAVLPPDDSVSSSCASSDGLPDCGPAAGADDQTDRLSDLLDEYFDPDGSHAYSTAGSGGGSAVGSGSAGANGRPRAIDFATMVQHDWYDGEKAGSVSLSLFSNPAAIGDGCGDATIGWGPQVSCQRHVVDGVIVQVGHGVQDGAERSTVRYDRTDGTVVIATADEATSTWWTDRSDPAPLEAAPATIEQMTALVTDRRATLGQH